MRPLDWSTSGRWSPAGSPRSAAVSAARETFDETYGSIAAAAAERADVPGGWRMPLPSHGVARASPMSSLYGMPK